MSKQRLKKTKHHYWYYANALFALKTERWWQPKLIRLILIPLGIFLNRSLMKKMPIVCYGTLPEMPNYSFIRESPSSFLLNDLIHIKVLKFQQFVMANSLRWTITIYLKNMSKWLSQLRSSTRRVRLQLARFGLDFCRRNNFFSINILSLPVSENTSDRWSPWWVSVVTNYLKRVKDVTGAWIQSLKYIKKNDNINTLYLSKNGK